MTSDTALLARRILSFLDLTSLNDGDDDAAILQLCRKAVTPAGRVAAVCVFPRFVPIASNALATSSIKVATVVNFPRGEDDLQAVVATTEQAIRAGADEIDLVFPWRAWLAGYRQFAFDIVRQTKAICGYQIRLKVIMESGAWEEGHIDALGRACRDAIEAGADMLKTSTGKIPRGASVDAALTMLQSIQRMGRPVGLKISGGVRTLDQARAYLELAERMMGSDWATPDHFRIGASGLLDDLLAHLGHAAKPSSSGNLY